MQREKKGPRIKVGPGGGPAVGNLGKNLIKRGIPKKRQEKVTSALSGKGRQKNWAHLITIGPNYYRGSG